MKDLKTITRHYHMGRALRRIVKAVREVLSAYRAMEEDDAYITRPHKPDFIELGEALDEFDKANKL